MGCGIASYDSYQVCYKALQVNLEYTVADEN